MREKKERRRRFGIADEEFLRGSLPMTKSEVRALILSRMMLERDDVIYDIGSGTGSVSVELALASPEGCVYAIEQKAEGRELVTANAKRFGVTNICPVAGRAPGALADLPAPAAAFIGGSSGSLAELFSALTEKNPSVRIALTAVTIETVTEAAALFEQYGMEPEIVQLQASRAKKIGSRHMMMAQNPIYLLSGGGESF